VPKPDRCASAPLPCLPPPGPLAREGSTGELALLVAEYALLERQLAALAAALSEADPKVRAAGARSGRGAGAFRVDAAGPSRGGPPARRPSDSALEAPLPPASPATPLAPRAGSRR
jgi:hypothetical protein